MFCNKCGKEIQTDQKFCVGCGLKVKTSSSKKPNFSKIKKIPIGKTLGVLFLLFILGSGIISAIFSSINEESYTKNESGLNKFDVGDSRGAIQDFNAAKDSAVGNSTKMETAKNIAYVYSSDGDYENALISFKEALSYAPEDSFDYYLISGEIAYLEGKPNSAILSYKKAYDMKPNNNQINNALNLFYLDVDEFYPEYVDFEQALIHAKKAYDNGEPNDNIGLENLGLAHFYNENYNQALNYFLKINPKQPYLNFTIGMTYVMLEDEINAEIYLQKSVDSGYTTWEEIYNY